MPNSKDFTRRAEDIKIRYVVSTGIKEMSVGEVLNCCEIRAISDALSLAYHEGRNDAIEECEKFLLDHYWDSIEDRKDLLNLHIKACFNRLRQLKSNVGGEDA